MGYDLRIYFPHEVFPREEWNSVLSLFDVEETVPDVSEYYHWDAEWWVKTETRTAVEPTIDNTDPEIEIDSITGQAIRVETSWVSITLSRLSPKTWGGCTPVGSHWRIYLETDSGCATKARWTQFAIPYYALGTIEGLTVHDCQWHNDENMYSFQNAEEWAKFAARALTSRGWISWDEWVRQGLFTDQGRVLF